MEKRKTNLGKWELGMFDQKLYWDEYYQKNKEHILESNSVYRKNNKEELNSKQRIRHNKNPSIRGKATKKWADANPEKVLERQLRFLEKNGLLFSLTAFEYKQALRTWGNIVKRRDKVCQNCGSDKNLNAHHVLTRAEYPEFTFVISNGITNCESCHKKAHGWNNNHS